MYVSCYAIDKASAIQIITIIEIMLFLKAFRPEKAFYFCIEKKIEEVLLTGDHFVMTFNF